jgi:hypothetical protein
MPAASLIPATRWGVFCLHRNRLLFVPYSLVRLVHQFTFMGIPILWDDIYYAANDP